MRSPRSWPCAAQQTELPAHLSCRSLLPPNHLSQSRLSFLLQYVPVSPHAPRIVFRSWYLAALPDQLFDEGAARSGGGLGKRGVIARALGCQEVNLPAGGCVLQAHHFHEVPRDLWVVLVLEPCFRILAHLHARQVPQSFKFCYPAAGRAAE
jgi:hypothetical protein